MATKPLPKTMKVVHQPDPKSPHLTLSEGPLPVPTKPDEYLIQVKATSPCLGELSWEVVDPHLFPDDSDRERVPGTECAGIIISGPPSGRFKSGDDVFFRTAIPQPGALREYTLVDEWQLALVPKNLSWIQAAATPLSALTAWQGLFTHGTLDKAALGSDSEALQRNSKTRVLVTGAGGGVGSWAVQFAAAAGAGAIIAVCSASKAEDVKTLGATEVIDYTKASIDDWVTQDPSSRECDLILDCVGGSTLSACWTAIEEGGTLLTIAGDPVSTKPDPFTKQVAKGEWFLVESLGSDLAEIAELIEDGKLTPLVDSVYEFEDFENAYAKVEEGHSRGKIVIKVAG